jgi:hypothetical protein
MRKIKAANRCREIAATIFYFPSMWVGTARCAVPGGSAAGMNDLRYDS